MDKKQELDKIAEKIEACLKCPLFKNKKAVAGFGNPDAEILFIGEAPGFHESVQGLPFVGASGKLLDKLLAEINIKRKDIWIGNMIKHRPPENRDPLPEELEACLPFLKEQIKIIDPKIIVTLGRFSMNMFFKDEKISQIHGKARFSSLLGKEVIVFPMYHPSAGLRNPRVLEEIKEDFKKLPVLLGKEKLKLENKEKESKSQMSLL
jgi:uracil-DNA glycosylase